MINDTKSKTNINKYFANTLHFQTSVFDTNIS